LEKFESVCSNFYQIILIRFASFNQVMMINLGTWLWWSIWIYLFAFIY